jgi:DNA-binding NarL/FixJ family response regulator
MILPTWKNIFQPAGILKVEEITFRRSRMARLCSGEHQQLQQRIYRVLQRHRWGIKESEIAQELGLHRRTVNNYLRALRRARRAAKEGWLWYASESPS